MRSHLLSKLSQLAGDFGDGFYRNPLMNDEEGRIQLRCP